LNDLAALEAVLFVTEAPVPIRELAEVLEVAPKRVEELLEELGGQLT
jgi:chromosome segregation and condensation protein ScpB